MNTKSGIFTHGFATRENTAFVVHFCEIKIDLTLEKSNILYLFCERKHFLTSETEFVLFLGVLETVLPMS